MTLKMEYTFRAGTALKITTIPKFLKIGQKFSKWAKRAAQSLQNDQKSWFWPPKVKKIHHKTACFLHSCFPHFLTVCVWKNVANMTAELQSSQSNGTVAGYARSALYIYIYIYIYMQWGYAHAFTFSCAQLVRGLAHFKCSSSDPIKGPGAWGPGPMGPMTGLVEATIPGAALKKGN